MIELGLHPDLSDADYRADPGINASLLKAVDRSPAYALHMQDQPSDKPCFVDGRAIHSEVLEPDAFGLCYLVAPADAPKKPTKAQWEAKKPSAEGMASMLYWDELKAEAGERVIISQSDCDEYRYIRDAVWSHPEAKRLLIAGHHEASVFAECTTTGLRIKARFDGLIPYASVGYDLKSVQDASPEGFRRAVEKFGWGIQDAHYDACFEATYDRALDAFAFIVVEKAAPYLVAVYYLSAHDRVLCRQRRDQLLTLTNTCRQSGKWPGYPDQAQEISLSGYYRNSIQQKLGDF